MIRLGLCCQFAEEPIKFYTTTAKHILSLTKKEAALKLSGLCKKNAESLYQSIEYCARNNIGAFRVNSQILPLKTHPQAGYNVADLPDGKDIIEVFKKCKPLAKKLNIRTAFHPDQFILLSSPDDHITKRSVDDLEYHAEVSQWIGADVINIHGGGAYGDKPSALDRVARNLKLLSKAARDRLTFENDDKIYSPSDLLPLCQKEGIPLVYDAHHHRCYSDDLSIEEATKMAVQTWNREPLFHISSPKEGWKGPDPKRHHDYIDKKDFPKIWLDMNITVEVEAKAKELAVKKLYKELIS